ncbi:MAG TPA: TIM barrel protein [Bacillota bacterium]|nr:TIM barrel protein [Bacillota bacterium]
MRPVPAPAFLAELPADAERARAAGADALEFPGDFCAVDESYGTATWQAAAKVLEAAGLRATVHLPFVWVDLAALDREVWEGSVRSVERAAEAMAPLQPALAAVHPANYATQSLLTAAPQSARPMAMMALADRVVAAVKRLRAGPLGAVIGLENLEGLPLELFQVVAEQADAHVCFDFGHALSDGVDPVAAFATLRDRVVGVHLHDAKRGRAHLALGQGDLDLAAVRPSLEGLPVVLELEQEAEDSLQKLLSTRSTSSSSL